MGVLLCNQCISHSKLRNYCHIVIEIKKKKKEKKRKFVMLYRETLT